MLPSWQVKILIKDVKGRSELQLKTPELAKNKLIGKISCQHDSSSALVTSGNRAIKLAKRQKQKCMTSYNRVYKYTQIKCTVCIPCNPSVASQYIIIKKQYYWQLKIDSRKRLLWCDQAKQKLFSPIGPPNYQFGTFGFDQLLLWGKIFSKLDLQFGNI